MNRAENLTDEITILLSCSAIFLEGLVNEDDDDSSVGAERF
jgi:hypothetical protein